MNSHIPIIAVTAYARDEDRRRCLEAGMTAHLSKPIRAAELHAALEHARVHAVAPEHSHVAVGVRPAILDLAAVETARGLPGAHGTSLLPELIELYFSDEEERLAALAESIAARQGDVAADRVHALGGNAASFGGTQVRHVALELESAARAANWAGVETRFGELRDACARLRTEASKLGPIHP